MELTPSEERKLKKLSKFMEDNQIATVDSFIELEEKVEAIAENVDSKLSGIQEELKKKLESELVLEIDKEELRGEAGFDGEDGEDYILTEQDLNDIAKKVKVPVVEKIIEKTEVIHETPIVTEIVKEVAVAESGEKILEKINEDETTLIRKEKVENFDILEKDIKELKARPIQTNWGRGGGGGNIEVLQSGSKKGSGSAINFIGATVTHDGHTATVTVAGAESDTLQTVTDRGATTTQEITTAGLHSPFLQATTSEGGLLKSNAGTDVALFGAGGGANITFYDGVKLNAQTADRIAGFDASKNLVALDTATYPSLTELSHLKGVTSSIQDQINGIPIVTPAGSDREIQFNDAGTFGASSAFYIDTDNTVFIASPTFPVLNLERTTTVTNVARYGTRIITSTTDNMADGFATGLVFGIKDATADENIVYLHAERSGADNSGEFAVFTAKAGTFTKRLSVDEEGITEITRTGVSTTTALAQNIVLTAQTASTGNGFGAGIYFRNQESTGVTPWTLGYIGIGRDGSDTSGIYQTWIASGGTLRKIYEIDKDGTAAQTQYINGYGYHLTGNQNNTTLLGSTNTNVHAQALTGYEANANSSRRFAMYAPSSIHTAKDAGFTNTAVLRSEVYPTLAIINNQANGTIQFRTDGSATTNTRVTISSNGLGVFATPGSNTGIDVADGSITALLGADNNLRTRTNATQKLFRLAVPHYTNAEEPVAGLIVSSSNIRNTVNIGGGSVLTNAATLLQFYTAADQTTLTGTIRANFDSNGHFNMVADDEMITWGAGGDAGIWYDGTDLHIDAQLVGSGTIILDNLPTSSAGLATGAVWNNGGVLNIV